MDNDLFKLIFQTIDPLQVVYNRHITMICTHVLEDLPKLFHRIFYKLKIPNSHIVFICNDIYKTLEYKHKKFILDTFCNYYNHAIYDDLQKEPTEEYINKIIYQCEQEALEQQSEITKQWVNNTLYEYKNAIKNDYHTALKSFYYVIFLTHLKFILFHDTE
jgi:hypothetical protein